jgi:hypothetical protein
MGVVAVDRRVAEWENRISRNHGLGGDDPADEVCTSSVDWLQ